VATPAKPSTRTAAGALRDAFGPSLEAELAPGDERREGMVAAWVFMKVSLFAEA
jgi:hypothetical protein